jgi:hypothetical protein
MRSDDSAEFVFLPQDGSGEIAHTWIMSEQQDFLPRMPDDDATDYRGIALDADHPVQTVPTHPASPAQPTAAQQRDDGPEPPSSG